MKLISHQSHATASNTTWVSIWNLLEDKQADKNRKWLSLMINKYIYILCDSFLLDIETS